MEFFFLMVAKFIDIISLFIMVELLLYGLECYDTAIQVWSNPNFNNFSKLQVNLYYQTTYYYPMAQNTCNTFNFVIHVLTLWTTHDSTFILLF